MKLTPKEYFEKLDEYINFEFYGLGKKNNDNEITLEEKLYTENSSETRKITLKYSGKSFAIKLDTEIKATIMKNKKEIKNKKEEEIMIPLFNFLDNHGRKWSKRCDFVVFNYYKSKIRVFLFEFKTKDIKAVTTSEQLEAGKNWCRSLVQIIKAYKDYSVTLYLTKYVLTTNEEPINQLENSNRYLKRNLTIRHYNYSEINGMHLDDLDDSQTETIK